MMKKRKRVEPGSWLRFCMRCQMLIPSNQMSCEGARIRKFPFVLLFRRPMQ